MPSSARHTLFKCSRQKARSTLLRASLRIDRDAALPLRPTRLADGLEHGSVRREARSSHFTLHDAPRVSPSCETLVPRAAKSRCFFKSTGWAASADKLSTWKILCLLNLEINFRSCCCFLSGQFGCNHSLSNHDKKDCSHALTRAACAFPVMLAKALEFRARSDLNCPLIPVLTRASLKAERCPPFMC